MEGGGEDWGSQDFYPVVDSCSLSYFRSGFSSSHSVLSCGIDLLLGILRADSSCHTVLCRSLLGLCLDGLPSLHGILFLKSVLQE